MGRSWESPEHDETAVASTSQVGCLVMLIMIPLGIVEMVVLLALDHRLGLGHRRDVGRFVGGGAIGNMMLAKWIADRILTRQGLSRSGKTVVTWHRADPGAGPDGDDEERVVVHARRGVLLACGLGCLGFSLALVAFLLLDSDIKEYRPFAVVGLGLFGAGTVGCFYDLARRVPQAWADASGVTGYPLRFGFRRRFVPWSSIESCDVETRHDIQGKPSVVLLTLKGAAGKRLLTMAFGGLTEDPAPLIKAIRAHLPKPDRGIDDW
ncbi:hypothetical protein OJF2_39620 [Aquisphaera giovannonii]|uniref:PH domain-containing protein n=1 Tax=Aquisphaera giovannonii TaxID=406548 RepID=A0A5B9W608_9BACT|nr:hypothetical protein [Aquisphaera giovannonii]QEH35410.1 hypothetical protein OJF2_39620 [Aquisphaera giovannonii]